jgi:Flp pilus assembly protein TadD
MMDVRSAWKRYKPATPDVMQFKTETVTIHSLEKRFPSELALLRRLTLQATSAALFEKLLKEPQDFQSLLQIGIIFGEEGDSAEAFRYLKRAAAVAPVSAEVVNNLANLHLLESKPEMALELYNKAAALDPGDPLILVNIAKTHLKMGNRSTAANIFASAVKMQPDLVERYRGLSLEVMR